MTDTFIFNPLDPAFLAERWPVYAQLRDVAPNCELPFGSDPTFVVARFDDVATVLRDHNVRSQAPGTPTPPWLGNGPAAKMHHAQMVLADPPDHTRLRKLVSHGFTPRTIEQLRAEIATSITSRFDDLARSGEIDGVADLAEYVPATAICTILGMPESDWHDLVRYAVDFVLIFSPFPLDEDAVARCDAACQYYLDYFGALVDERRASPGDDVVGRLILAEEEGERLTRDELMATLHSFLNAGFETTMSTISNGLVGLLTHPDQLKHWHDHPDVTPNGVEEILRWNAPVHFTWRYGTEPIELSTGTYPAGSRFLLGLAAGNRDTRKFANPDAIDVTRDDIQHLSFGAGRHFCLGAHLARMQLELFFGELVHRFPYMAIGDAKLEREDHVLFPTLKRLPMTLR